MVNVLTVTDIKKLVSKVGMREFFIALVDEIEKEYTRWDLFQKSPRHATHVEGGVIELMPACDDEFYSYKYVNGHPKNTKDNKQTVIATGGLSSIDTGYPLLVSEMTLLTAFRTAATSALAAKYLARSDSNVFGFIGTGAQSEFQVMAFDALFDLKQVRYFDIDAKAMEKFSKNLTSQHFELVACSDAQNTIEGVDIITTATAAKKQAQILSNDWINPGLHINGIGGDTPGKTEFSTDVLKRCKIVVEFLGQSQMEGEIQQDKNIHVYAELWELASKKKKGRESDDEITFFDSVGFAIEDFAVLKLVERLAKKHGVGTQMDLVPTIDDPKDLFGVL